jgi:hypothetical protein
MDKELIKKEAELYKSVSNFKLKSILIGYKFLSLCNSKTLNFIFSLICVGFAYYVFGMYSLLTTIFILLFHYFFFCKYLYDYKKFKLVSDKNKEEVDAIIEILEEYKKNRETKKPL